MAHFAQLWQVLLALTNIWHVTTDSSSLTLCPPPSLLKTRVGPSPHILDSSLHHWPVLSQSLTFFFDSSAQFSHTCTSLGSVAYTLWPHTKQSLSIFELSKIWGEGPTRVFNNEGGGQIVREELSVATCQHFVKVWRTCHNCAKCAIYSFNCLDGMSLVSTNVVSNTFVVYLPCSQICAKCLSRYPNKKGDF